MRVRSFHILFWAGGVISLVGTREKKKAVSFSFLFRKNVFEGVFRILPSTRVTRGAVLPR